MGMVRNAKVNQLSQEAAKARQERRSVFAAKLNYPMTKPDFSGEIVDWSVIIEAIEQQGWALYHFAGAADKKGRPEALCVFRLR